MSTQGQMCARSMQVYEIRAWWNAIGVLINLFWIPNQITGRIFHAEQHGTGSSISVYRPSYFNLSRDNVPEGCIEASKYV